MVKTFLKRGSVGQRYESSGNCIGVVPAKKKASRRLSLNAKCEMEEKK